MNMLGFNGCFLLWLALYLSARQQVGALPNSLGAYSRVVYKKPEWKEPELYTVEEFMNQKDENVMLKVRSDKDSAYKNYYRINGEPPARDNSDPGSLVEYDHEEHECKFLKTDQWPLESVSRFLRTLRTNSGLKFGKDKARDRTALGPIALLRLVLANAELFKVGSHSESSEAHFMAAFSLPDKQLLRVILSLPEALFEGHKIDRKERDQSTTVLNEMKLDELYALKISFVVAKRDEFTAGCGPEILFENLANLESLHISFMAIQERSVSKHQGLSAFDPDEENPFTLPGGTGCGSQGRLFFLEAKQFSGLFSGETPTDQQFVAFDGRSNHLRIDRLGESKMIYNFGSQKSVLYVADHQLETEQGGGSALNQPKDKCASVLLQKQDNELDLIETRSLADIIGFDLGIGLSYLGSKTLEDGVHCLVFERELSSIKKIPLLAKLNMRIQPKAGDRIYLTLYFVDEFKESKQNAERSQDRDAQMDSLLLDSMWLKRLELQTKKSITSYNQLVSQITFSQSSWNLNVWTEYEDDRRSRSLHPVRTFDTIECKPPAASGDQTFKIELIIEQIISAKSQIKQLQEANSIQRQYAFFEQPEKLEEAVMAFLAAATRIPRSHINQLELILPEHRLGQTNAKSNSYRVFAGVEIADPLEFQFTKNLLGWVKSYKEIALALKENVVLLRAEESNNNRYECMMNVATSLMQDVKSATMLFCPRVGCGYVKDLANFEFIRAEAGSKDSGSSQAPTTGNYWEMCEIHSLNKIGLPIETGNRLNVENIKSQLMSAKFSMKSMLGESQPESVSDDDFVGKIVKVSVLKHEHHSSQPLGRHLRSGYCFNEQQAKPVDLEDHKELQTVQFALDKHQSSAIYCHKACLLYPHCQTYSYSQTRRVCTLTSLPASEALSYTLRHADLSTKDSSCHLYGLSSLRLYSSLQMSLITSLAGLDSTHQYYFTKASRETCAALCHDNELEISDGSTSGCRGFKYFSVNSMCAIEDKNSNLYKEQLGNTMVASLGSSYGDKSKYFRSLLANPSEWTDTNQCQFYERDYAQYYEHKARTKFEAPKQSSSTTDSETVAVSELKTLFDIDLQDCLRECTLIEDSCLMLDHCFHPINGTPTRYCTMYRMQHDDSQGGQSLTLSQLLDAIEKTSSKKQRPEFRLNPACNNYRLTEDYSMLKSKLSQVTRAEDLALKDISELDANKSATYIEGMKRFIDDKLLAERGSSGAKRFTFWSASLMLALGSVAGLLLAAYLVEPTRVRPTIEVISNHGSNTNSCSSGTSPSNISGFRMAQSSSVADLQSRPEMNELFELYEN